jgi:hypothetical protein
MRPTSGRSRASLRASATNAQNKPAPRQRAQIRPSSTACSHVRFQGAAHSFLLRRRGLRRSLVRTAGDRTLRRRLNKLSCAGWVPHDRGSVSGLPRSRVEHRSGDRLITGTRIPHRGPASSSVHRILADLLFVGSVSAAWSDELRLRNAGDRPDEADHLAGDRGGDHDLRLAGCSEAPISRAQPDLRFPGDVPDHRG